MAKKNNKVSVGAFEKVMNEQFSDVIEAEWRGLTLSINKTLPLKDALSIIEDVVASVFDSGTGEYRPEVADFALRIRVLEKYAGFTLPSSIEAKYDLVYKTDAVAFVIERINQEQYRDIVNAINEKKKYLSETNIQALKKKSEEFVSLLEGFTEQIASFSSEDMTKLISAISGSKIDEDKLIRAYIDNTTGKADDEQL